MNEELIRQAVADTVHCENYPSDGGFRTGQEDAAEAIRLCHARAVAPLVEAAQALLDRYVQAIGNEGIECLKLRTALAPFQQEAASEITPRHPNPASTKSRVEYCYLGFRKTDGVCMHIHEDGRVLLNLEGYAIVPLEEYADHEGNVAEMREAWRSKKSVPSHHQPEKIDG